MARRRGGLASDDDVVVLDHPVRSERASKKSEEAQVLKRDFEDRGRLRSSLQRLTDRSPCTAVCCSVRTRTRPKQRTSHSLSSPSHSPHHSPTQPRLTSDKHASRTGGTTVLLCMRCPATTSSPCGVPHRFRQLFCLPLASLSASRLFRRAQTTSCRRSVC
jgi:hypothetical protein